MKISRKMKLLLVKQQFIITNLAFISALSTRITLFQSRAMKYNSLEFIKIQQLLLATQFSLKSSISITIILNIWILLRYLPFPKSSIHSLLSKTLELSIYSIRLIWKKLLVMKIFLLIKFISNKFSQKHQSVLSN